MRVEPFTPELLPPHVEDMFRDGEEIVYVVGRRWFFTLEDRNGLGIRVYDIQRDFLVYRGYVAFSRRAGRIGWSNVARAEVPDNVRAAFEPIAKMLLL